MKKLIGLLSLSLLLIACGTNNSIKTMSLNIRYANEKDGVNYWDHRKEMMVKFIKSKELDFFGNQEVLSHQLDFLASELSGYKAVGVGRDDGKKAGEFSNIFYKESRFNLLDSNTFWLSETPEVVGSIGWDAMLPRVVTYAHLDDKKSGKKIYIFNTHFDHKGVNARRQSALLLVDKINEIVGSNTNDAIVIMGDLNFERTDEAYNAFSSYADSKKTTKTPVNGTEFTTNSFGKPEPLMNIDYIFVNNKLSVESYEQALVKEGEVFMSDHNAVLAELTLL